MSKLFVGSLPFELTEDQLHDLFKDCGQVVSAKLIVDRESYRSRGFGFVEMSNEAEAQTAIEKLNGSTVGGRQIVVNIARPMEARDNRGGGGGGFRKSGGGGGRGGFNKGGGGGGFKRW